MGLLSCESCWDAWLEAPRSPARLPVGLRVGLGPGDAPAEAAGEDPPNLGSNNGVTHPQVFLLFERQRKQMWWGKVSEGSRERCSPSALGHQGLCSPAPGWRRVRAPRARCPHTGARGLGAGKLPCPAQTMLLHAKLGERLRYLFEIQIHART